MSNPKDMIEELDHYSHLDGTEWGESAQALCIAWRSRSMFSDELINALGKEIESFLENVKENAKIVTNIESHEYTVTELEWN